MTRDIDMVVELAVTDADRVCQLFGDDFYVDRDAVRSAIETEGMFNLIHRMWPELGLARPGAPKA